MNTRLVSFLGLLLFLACVFAQDASKKAQAAITDVEILVSDSTDEIDIKQAKKVKVEFPTTLTDVVPAESFQHIYVHYKLKNKQTATSVQAHQSVLRIVNIESQEEDFVVAQYDASKGYSAHVVVKDLKGDFHASKDIYEFHLIVGDISLAAPITWKLASNVHLKINSTAASSNPFGIKPEIKHEFRRPEKRPPQTISFAFTIAVLAPLAVLVIGWPLVGANLWNFPTGAYFIPAVAFQATIAAILALYFFYWVGLNMIQTLTYLGFLSIPFLFFGSKTLNHLATVNSVKSHSD